MSDILAAYAAYEGFVGDESQAAWGISNAYANHHRNPQEREAEVASYEADQAAARLNLEAAYGRLREAFAPLWGNAAAAIAEKIFFQAALRANAVANPPPSMVFEPEFRLRKTFLAFRVVDAASVEEAANVLRHGIRASNGEEFREDFNRDQLNYFGLDAVELIPSQMKPLE